MDENNKQLADIIDIDGHRLSLEAIEGIARDNKIRRHYEKRYKRALYSNILRSLTHETFDDEVAISLWKEIKSHMELLNGLLGRNVGIAVAAMDYLFNVKGKLSEPKIIEEEKSDFIAETSTKDKLTGLFMRDVFDAVIKKEIHRATRNNTPLCLLLMDLDDFKQINDTHGHLKGDEVLSEIGTIINKSVREMDLAARYGGEEMAIIMPDTSAEYACQAGNRIRKAIQKRRIGKIRMTVSVGVSEAGKSINTPEKLIRAADDALYRAKKEGKNRLHKADLEEPI